MKSKIVSALILMLLIVFSLQISSCNGNKIKKEIKISIEDPENNLLPSNRLIGKTYISKLFKIIIVKPNSHIDYKIIIENTGNNIDPKMKIINPNVPQYDGNDNLINQIPDDISNEISDFIKTVNKNSKK